MEVKWSEVQSLSCVQFFVTPWTAACQAPPSMEFSKQEYWSGFLFPPSKEMETMYQIYEDLHSKEIGPNANLLTL